MTISARGLSLDSMTCSTMPSTEVLARTVRLLAVVLATNRGGTDISCAVSTAVSSATSSSTSPWEMKKVRIACSSYCARFCGVSGTTTIVVGLTTL